MKPALSVILLTTLIGAGQGLFLAAYSAEWLVMLNMLQPASGAYASVAALLSFLLIAAGLLASFFHLGHPERAWRAAAMWRTSWLSREVIALPLAMLTVLGYALSRMTWTPAHVLLNCQRDRHQQRVYCGHGLL